MQHFTTLVKKTPFSWNILTIRGLVKEALGNNVPGVDKHIKM